MSAAGLVRLACDYPACTAKVEVEGTVYDVELGRTRLPTGWTVSDGGRIGLGRRIVGCPLHGPEVTATESALYDWEVREVEARNAWAKKNPPPKVPAWLRGGR